LTNQAKRAITLEFPTDQRIEIYLLSSAQDALTKWSENHAFNEKPGIAWRKPVNELYPSDRIIQPAIQKGTRFTIRRVFARTTRREFRRLADKMSILGARKMCVYAKHKRIERDV
jgi:Intracellular proteinase inhibitor